jgi:hypothetical protein
MLAIGLAKLREPPVPWLTPSVLTQAFLVESGYSPMERLGRYRKAVQDVNHGADPAGLVAVTWPA